MKIKKIQGCISLCILIWINGSLIDGYQQRKAQYPRYKLIKANQFQPLKCGLACQNYQSQIKEALNLTKTERKLYRKVSKKYRIISKKREENKLKNKEIRKIVSGGSITRFDRKRLQKDLRQVNQTEKELDKKEKEYLSSLQLILPEKKFKRYLILRQLELDCDKCRIY